MSKEASDVALNWCIELISMSEILEPESKYAILDALKDKISSGKFSPNTEFRMYCESITRLTADNTGGFARLRPENVNEVFQSLIKMGDVAHSLGDESIPTPQMTLMAQMYAETMLTHLRLPYRDVDNFAESVDFYDLDSTFQESSPWLNVESLDNVRVDLKKQAARVTEDRCDGILRRWNTAKDTLVELAKYCGEVLEAMGPSFLERVAADVTAGRYKPPMTDGVLIPDDAVDAMAEISKTKRRERELLEAARVLRASLTPQKRPAPTKATEPEADKKAKASDEGAAIGRNRSAFEKLRAANAAVADPLGDALRASDAVAKPREPDDVWKALADGAEEEKDVSFWDDDEEDEDEESPAAKAARAKQAAKKMVIRPHERGATARTVEWDETQTQTRTLKNTQSNVSTPVTADRPIGARTTRVGTAGRKAYTRWTKAQETELARLVELHGVGSWARIMEAGRDVFGADRTAVNLKDKWRVLTKARG